jgi:site-specific DNA-methyltransferase (adenine-specific)
MTPYYEEDGITIYCGDCRELGLQVGLVDAIVTDPPYGDTSLEWDRIARGWLDSAELLTSTVWCFGSLRMFLDMARTGETSRWKLAQEIVWEKHNGSSFHADRFKRVHELAVQFYQGEWDGIYKAPAFTLDATARAVRRKQRPPHTGHIDAGSYMSQDGGPRLMRSVIYARSCHGEAEHPTQKPISIIDPILRFSVPAGGIVADLFAGSGSTLVAAKAIGLRAIGIEIEERYCEIAAKRLQQSVFDYGAPVGIPEPQPLE